MAADRGGTRVTARAFAKINLTLRILGHRADGYHEVRTTYQSLALYDRVMLSERRGPFELRSNDPRCPTDRTNLVWRAAEQVWRASGRRGAPQGVAVKIDKRIPIQAGLGGGSSDAAAALRAFAKLWRLELDAATMHRLAAQLGADVPFFIEGGTALGIERGDVLFQLIDRPPAWVVLVVPQFGVNTREAYAWWDALASSLLATSPARRTESGNDLQQAVVARHPEIATLVRALRRHGASYAAMSGSGSAVFGLFDARAVAEQATRRLAGRWPRTLVTKTVDRARYLKLTAPRKSAGLTR